MRALFRNRPWPEVRTERPIAAASHTAGKDQADFFVRHVQGGEPLPVERP